MVNLKKVRGISVRIACEYCKEAGRVSRGKVQTRGRSHRLSGLRRVQDGGGDHQHEAISNADDNDREAR